MPVQSNDIQGALSRLTFVFNAGTATMQCIKLVGSLASFPRLDPWFKAVLALSGAGVMAYPSIVCAVFVGSDLLSALEHAGAFRASCGGC